MGKDMKCDVDQELCIGCGICEDTCPEVFKIVDNKAFVILDLVPIASESDALSAEEGCPVQVISHKEW